MLQIEKNNVKVMLILVECVKGFRWKIS